MGVAEFAFPVPFLGCRNHEDLDAGFDHGVDHLVVVAEHVAFERRDQKSSRSTSFHSRNQMVVVGVDLDSHQIAVVDVGTVGDKTLEHVGRFSLAVDTVGNCNATLTHAVDESTVGAVAKD